MKILVTGAGGFLGREVVNQLLKRGHAVRAVVRPSSDRPAWPNEVEVFPADLRNDVDYNSMLDGIAAVIHLAAATSGGDEAQFNLTVVATEKFLAALAKSDTKRVLHVSSLVVYDWRKAHRKLDENTPVLDLPDPLGAYTVAKVWQERIVQRAASENGWDLTIVRPGFVWGSDHSEIGGMGRHSGRFYVMFGPFTRLPLCHVTNCADCIATAIETPASIGEILNIIDDDSIRVWRYVRAYARQTRQPGFLIPVPYRVGQFIAKLAQVTSRLIFGSGGKLPSLLTPLRYQWQFKPVRFGYKKVRRVLNWTPPLSFEKCALTIEKNR